MEKHDPTRITARLRWYRFCLMALIAASLGLIAMNVASRWENRALRSELERQRSIIELLKAERQLLPHSETSLDRP